MRELWFSYVDLSLKCVDLVLFGFYVLLCWSYVFGGIYFLLPLSYLFIYLLFLLFFWSISLAACIFC